MRKLGFKQQKILDELFRKRKKVSIALVRLYYANENQAISSIKTLELLGYIKKSREFGMWELVE